MLLLSPQNFTDYELIDSGDFEKLERWGTYITCRPEPQAVWSKNLSQREWDKMMHVKFVAKSSSAGNWQKLKEMPDRWVLEYEVGRPKTGDRRRETEGGRPKTEDGRPKTEDGRPKTEGGSQQPEANSSQPESCSLKFRLALTSFKHVGLFPEQAVNWDYIYSSIKKLKSPQPKFLNLFAYTGAASLAAKAAGADVVHLDSIKQVVTWAHENMELSNLDNIRWVVEDAAAFVKREVKRGKKYHGIILDPPAYGHGPSGENWKLEDMINEMMKNVYQLLDEEEHFLLLNTYSLGFSSLIIENLFNSNFKNGKMETGELFLQSTSNQKLPLGVFGRWERIS